MSPRFSHYRHPNRLLLHRHGSAAGQGISSLGHLQTHNVLSARWIVLHCASSFADNSGITLEHEQAIIASFVMVIVKRTDQPTFRGCGVSGQISIPIELCVQLVAQLTKYVLQPQDPQPRHSGHNCAFYSYHAYLEWIVERFGEFGTMSQADIRDATHLTWEV